MTRIGRMMMGALAGVLVLGLASARAVEPKYLPSDAEIVFTVNVKQILESELIKKNKDAVDQVKGLIDQALPEDHPARKYLKAMDFDIFKDLHSVTVASGPQASPEAGFILVEGKFNNEKFNSVAEGAARDNGDVVKIIKAGNQQLVQITPAGGTSLFAAIGGKNMLIVTGAKDALTDALARVAGNKKNALKKEVRALLGTTSTKQSVSLVATGSAITKMMEDAPIPDNQRKQLDVAAKALKSIEGFSVAITLTKEVQFLLGVNAKDAATAKNLADQTQKGLTALQFLIQLQAMNNEQLAPVMDILKTLKVTNQGSNLVIQGKLTAEVIASLLKNLPGQE